MRARLIASTLAIAGFVLTLEVVSWQNRSLPPATGWRGNPPVTPAARPASIRQLAAPAPLTDPQSQAPASLPVAAADVFAETASGVAAPDPETTLPIYGEGGNVRDNETDNARRRNK